MAYADELNVYADDDAIAFVQDAIAESGRKVELSVFLSWEWDKWPSDPASEVDRWRQLRVNRLFISLGGVDMLRRLDQLGSLLDP